MRAIVCTLATASIMLTTVPSFAQTFTLNGATNCPGTAQGVSFPLAAGTHHVQWVSGAYSLFSSNGQNGGLTWFARARCYVHATGETLFVGGPAGSIFYATLALAEAAAVGIHPLTISTASQVTFYLSDGGGCGDNRGTITLMFVAPVRADESTWGAIKALYR